MGDFIDCSECERRAKVFLITPNGFVSRKKFCKMHWKKYEKDYHYKNHKPTIMEEGILTGKLQKFEERIKRQREEKLKEQKPSRKFIQWIRKILKF